MKTILVGFGCLFFLKCFAQTTPLAYVAYKTTEEINIDGKAEEESWKDAHWTADFIDIEGQKIPKYRTNVKMLWDEEYFYVYAKMEEPHIWATLKQRDTVIFYNNDFEIFIDPDGDAQKYMELEINALSTVWDLMLIEAYREGGNAIDSWNIDGLKAAVNIEGTLNNSRDIDKFWEVEIAMPWSVLTEAGKSGKIPVNDFWRVNFSRVNWDYQFSEGRYSRKKDDDNNFLSEYNWAWSPQGVINMHEPERWGYVYFSDKEPSESLTFSIPKDEHIRWKMYELYRAQKRYFVKNQKWATSVEKIESEPIQILGETIHTKVETHSAGYNIVIKSPFTGLTYLIQQNGTFIQLSN